MITLIIPTLDPVRGQAAADLALAVAGVDADAVVVHDLAGDGYTRTVNRGLCDARAGHVVLYNDDNSPDAGWLARLMEAMDQWSRAHVWFAGPSGPCRTPPQNGGRRGDARQPRIVPHLSGFCLLIHPRGRQPLSEQFTHYGSDVHLQWCARARGGRSLWAPDVYVDHGLHAPREPWWTQDHKTLQKIWRI